MMQVSLFSYLLSAAVVAGFVLFAEFGEMENCKIPWRRYLRYKLCLI